MVVRNGKLPLTKQNYTRTHTRAQVQPQMGSMSLQEISLYRSAHMDTRKRERDRKNEREREIERAGGRERRRES